MPTISIITPFRNGLDLLPDYAAAVQGAHEVITVDNTSDPDTAAALKGAGGVYIRNETNAGFAAANNQGYARATGDIIVFLNSDVAPAGDWLAMVAANVRDGALYGPSLAHQLVAGRWLPYIEGWCIAATRATWERLVEAMWDVVEERDGTFMPVGPWDNFNFRSPYWEDNDLCLRAMQAGISLIQTAWPIQHKGGRTAGPLMRHADSFERNRATFTERVRAAFDGKEIASSAVYARYMQECQTHIQHHLPLLYSLARGNVVELGTRTGVSTAAFLAGVEKRGGFVYSVDIDAACGDLYQGHPQWRFIHGSSTDDATIVAVMRDLPGLACIDVLFIDTEHVYELAAEELRQWSHYLKPGGVILMHDPETFPGVRAAAEAFAEARGWPMTVVLPNNGMVIIDVPITKDAPDDAGVSLEGAAWAAEQEPVHA